MRKITVKFNKLQDIENLKKIMKNVYASNSDHLPDIAIVNSGEVGDVVARLLLIGVAPSLLAPNSPELTINFI